MGTAWKKFAGIALALLVPGCASEDDVVHPERGTYALEVACEGDCAPELAGHSAIKIRELVSGAERSFRIEFLEGFEYLYASSFPPVDGCLATNGLHRFAPRGPGESTQVSDPFDLCASVGALEATIVVNGVEHSVTAVPR